MATIVVPFRGPGGKQRLAAVSEKARAAIAQAMLADVLEACVASAPTVVVTNDAAARDLAEEMGARTVGDPGGGQGAAVTAALALLGQGVALIVNADLPCAEPSDLLALACAVPAGGMALVEASDGTTNALGLSRPDLFAPLYGPGSAARFRAHAASLGAEAIAVALPNLRTDVDTVDQLELLRDRVGPHTRAVLAAVPS
jgi:2-phospho-L-lactate guanylyltransferase